MDKEWYKKACIDYLKDEITRLIKYVSDCWGGDDAQWLSDYIKDTLEDNKNNLQATVDCFYALKKQARWDLGLTWMASA